MHLIFTLSISIILIYLLTFLAKKIKIPHVVALIVGGIIIGSPLIKEAILEPNTQFISYLGNIGFVTLMFLAGLESSKKLLFAEEKDSFFITLLAAITPFLMGFIVFYLLGFSLAISLVIGVCMSITAEATNAQVLLGLKKLRTKVGSVIMDSGILDDMIGIFIFILVTLSLGHIMIGEYILIGSAILAFFVGVWIEPMRGNPFFKPLENILMHLIVPFFFIIMGLNFDFRSLIINPLLLVLIIVIAIIGKISGTMLAKPFTKFNCKQLYLIGWAMNSRGAIELAVALIAFRANLIPIGIYSSLVTMAIVTTVIFPFIITNMIKKDKKIMDV